MRLPRITFGVGLLLYLLLLPTPNPHISSLHVRECALAKSTKVTSRAIDCVGRTRAAFPRVKTRRRLKSQIRRTKDLCSPTFLLAPARDKPGTIPLFYSPIISPGLSGGLSASGCLEVETQPAWDAPKRRRGK
jgi:hypothetical protein